MCDDIVLEVAELIYAYISDAAAAGDLFALQHWRGPISQCNIERCWEKAAAYGRIECLKWLHTKYIRGYKSNVVDAAVRGGHIDCLKWLYEIGAIGTEKTFDLAAKHGHLHILEWLYINRAECYSINAMGLAAKNGHLDCLKWLHKIGDRYTVCAMDWAAENGHLECLKWLHSHDGRCTSDALDWAAKSGHLECLKWLYANARIVHSKYPDLSDYQNKEDRYVLAMNSAARSGHLDCLKWLYDEAGGDLKITRYTIEAAATNGHLECLKWLYAKIKERGSERIIESAAANYAAESGYMDVLVWLYEHDIKCTIRGMEGAIKQNHFEIVKYLNEVGFNVYSSECIYSAAFNGNLDILKFLYRGAELMFTVDDIECAIECAARHGHLETAKWLYSLRPGDVKITEQAMDEAVSSGNLDCLKWLYSQSGIKCTARALTRAAEAGFLEVIKYLHSIGCQCSDRALELAADNNHIEVVKWLLDNVDVSIKPAIYYISYKSHPDLLKLIKAHVREKEWNKLMNRPLKGQKE